MLSCAVLRKTATGWEFVSEEALEDFVEAHLENLLGLTIVKRQYKDTKHRSYYKIRTDNKNRNIRIITAEDFVCEYLEVLVDRALNTWQNRV